MQYKIESMPVALPKKVNTITEQGKKTLGLVLKFFREQKDWSMDDLILEINRITGHKVSKSTISQLERGNADPKWNTLAVIAATEFIKDKDGVYLTTNDLFAIACEEINPINLIQSLSKSRSKSMRLKPLSEMIKEAMDIYGITQEHLELKLREMRSKNITDVTVERLHELQTDSGDLPTREESRTLYMLLDTEGLAFPDHEWFGDPPIENPAVEDLRDNNHYVA